MNKALYACVGGVVILVAMGLMHEGSAVPPAQASEPPAQNIHNNARKCINHCHNVGLIVSNWDGAYPALRAQHGCRCREAEQ